MKIAFRADASLQIGSGHVMRCLTLANELTVRGADCHFICREHPGHLIELIRSQGYTTYSLPYKGSVEADLILNSSVIPDSLAHANWLGVTQEQDAEVCSAILKELQPDWLIADHYGLDARWELALKHLYRHLLVVDDLADRPHACDLLLDQNLGREVADYGSLIPEYCRVLVGPKYALLRPEFAGLREYSLQRRKQSRPRNILITMGGVDQPNATGQVLEALKHCSLPADCQITAVIGGQSPWLHDVSVLAAEMPWRTKVLVNISDMAQRMADSDLAIGAAGSTSWERCCLGVPTLMVVLAENQWPGARALQSSQGAQLVGEVSDIREQLPVLLSKLFIGHGLEKMGRMATQLTDGLGVVQVAGLLKRLFAA
ncbi:UDP-2,4-diacetamido-2,4,6-trideoxy-beta-L-altropyranose hydrolase [Microbulbifer rhizosphaerae]|uniref:UDP-2,4-diacetamido-2,4, 6-trideoxy-beta-L-altropyranose hydrolase n=1 Tax=Microbulbifer rhizosphaerae TaxID=1562603 RepID=A0A7W4WG64_9GAMM|nr:UDP-2,4-diacetamido-2,4,6-trideoxy-beta-L-altropyranose hydrolase [Microbulbifer rhizosphaerae]MBB3063187.1 UDP-2,4-diacetamido-2,4,6-trideoxy-beta-L-altropyranose hydrolase [Microbulbifer rhizosphaerae]